MNWFFLKKLYKFLAFGALFGIIVGSTSYGLVSSINNNSNKKNFSLTNKDTNVANQPTINDVVNGDVSSSNEPITTNNGNYILPTINHGHIPGLIKLNSFVSGLYGINFDAFPGYHVRKIIQNYNNENQYFVLLVNDSASVTASWETTGADIKFTINNPGHVLSILDAGTSFNITADYQLDAPILDSTLNTYYQNMYFQPPLNPTDQQVYEWKHWHDPWANLTPDTLHITQTPQIGTSPGSGPFLYQTKTIASNSSLKHINETWDGYSQNIATLLYLNSLNNMILVSNKVNNTGSEAIYLFGGNQYVNLWFYNFYVNENPPTTTPVLEYASAYANYSFHWGAIAPATTSAEVSSSDVLTQKAYNFKVKMQDSANNSSSSWSLKKYKDAGFFGYYVSGAKLVNKPNSQILLTLATPNFTLAKDDTVIVFSTNATWISWSAYEQDPGSFYSTFYGSIPIEAAIQTTEYRKNQVDNYTQNKTWSSSDLWNPRYTNYSYSFMNYLSNDIGQIDYGVTADANDGMASNVYNKVVAYLPEDIDNNNIALSYNRDKMQAVVTAKDGITSKSTKLSLYKSDTRLNQLSNISYADQTWFLWFTDTDISKGKNEIIYFFSYDSLTGQVSFSQTNLFLNDGSQILNILPLNQDYIYVLARKNVAPSGSTGSDYQVTPLLYHLSDIKGNYSQNEQYNNLITNQSVPKLNGVPAYSMNGIQNDDQKAIWGTVSFKDIDYISKAGFLANPASFLADDSSALQTLVNYQPGWDGQDFKVTAKANADNQLELSVSIKYFNGQYFSPQQLQSQSALTQTYGGFSALPNWVLPVAIAVPILFLAIILALGLGLGIPMARTRKLQDKGFTQTFKKVDTLTSAVGSVYKKIITETSTVKKKPQMLKSATKSIKKPESSAPKPQAPKPAAQGLTKEIAKAPNSPTRPIINKPSAPTAASSSQINKPKAPPPVKNLSKQNINSPKVISPNFKKPGSQQAATF